MMISVDHHSLYVFFMLRDRGDISMGSEKQNIENETDDNLQEDLLGCCRSLCKQQDLKVERSLVGVRREK